MTISFPFTGSLTFVSFIAWIPLLLVEGSISKLNYRSRKVFTHALITFLIYNVGTTWWVIYASAEGALMAFIANTLLMALVFYAFHLTKKYVGGKEGYLALLFYWIGFEYFHYNWESSWPWLSLGNVFSIHPSWVQWYSYTGVLGGSLWVLLINLLLFRTYQNVWLKGESWKIQTPLFYLAGITFILPMTISLITYFQIEDKGKQIEVVAVQPNIDPYDEKFSSSLFDQLEKISTLIRQRVTPNTQLIVAPETAISSSVEESEFKRTNVYLYLKELKSSIGNPILYYGASSYQFFEEKNSVASRKLEGGPGYIEHYNSSMMMDKNNDIDFIHKSKLVPGVEKIPFAKNFTFLEDLSIDLGGTTGTLGVEPEPRIFETPTVNFAPVVCYESIFGEFVSIQCRKGAQLICIATNDGWWKDTPGYKQHTSFASLRAIENRRSVVRAANTGTSCFVNQRGDIYSPTDWWVPAVIRGKVALNNEMSFYTKYGNVIGRSFGFVSILLILYTVVRRFKKYVVKES